MRRQQILNSYHKFVLSAKCCHLRDKERRLFAMKSYHQANEVRAQADEMEIMEIQRHQEEINLKVDREESKLRKAQQLKVNTLMKRI